ncbi:hypothetical protein TWF281_004335 [Arthrobotrys megalospora]
MLSERSKTRNSPSYLRSSPPLLRSQSMDSVPKYPQFRERLTSKNDPQQSSRVHRRLPATRSTRPARRNTYPPHKEEITVNERLFAQTIAIAETMEALSLSEGLSAEDVSYALARYLGSGRKGNPNNFDLSRWETTTQTYPTLRDTSTRCSQCQTTTCFTCSTDIHRQPPKQALDLAFTHIGCQFSGDTFDDGAIELEA